MDSLRKRIGALTSPRAVLGLLLALGSIAGQGGRGTMAYFTSSIGSATAQAFQAGTLTATTSTFGTGSNFDGTSYGWTTTNPGANCKVINHAADTAQAAIATQGLVPGGYCWAPITLINSGNVDAYGRLRFVNLADASGSAPSMSMMNKLVFFINEYDSLANQANDCNDGTPTYQPSNETSAATISAPNASATTLLNVSPTAGVIIGQTDATTAGTRGAMGIAPGSFSVTPPTEASMGASSYFNILGQNTVDGGNNATFQVSAGATAGSTATRYFCAAMFLPSDTALTAANGAGDNTVQGASLSLGMHFVLAQKSGRP